MVIGKLLHLKQETSTRTLPMPDILVNDLKKLKEYNMKHQYQFTQKYFVFGDINPIHPDVLRRHKNDYAKKPKLKKLEFMTSDILVHHYL